MFAWLKRRLKSVGPDLSGASLDLATYYEVSAPKDHRAFFLALENLLPGNAVLYFEGTSISPDAESAFASFPADHPLKIARGTIWPTPATYHVAFCPASLKRISEMCITHVAPEICDHFHAYSGDAVLLEWHDALFDDPLLLSSQLSLRCIQEFAERLGCTYRESTKLEE